jgi:hypothetical protein
MGRASGTHGRKQKCILGFSGGNLKERDHWADVYIDEDNIKMDVGTSPQMQNGQFRAVQR